MLVRDIVARFAQFCNCPQGSDYKAFQNYAAGKVDGPHFAEKYRCTSRNPCDCALTKVSFPPAICVFCAGVCKNHYTAWRGNNCHAIKSEFKCPPAPKSFVSGFKREMQLWTQEPQESDMRNLALVELSTTYPSSLMSSLPRSSLASSGSSLGLSSIAALESSFDADAFNAAINRTVCNSPAECEQKCCRPRELACTEIRCLNGTVARQNATHARCLADEATTPHCQSLCCESADHVTVEVSTCGAYLSGSHESLSSHSVHGDGSASSTGSGSGSGTAGGCGVGKRVRRNVTDATVCVASKCGDLCCESDTAHDEGGLTCGSFLSSNDGVCGSLGPAVLVDPSLESLQSSHSEHSGGSSSSRHPARDTVSELELHRTICNCPLGSTVGAKVRQGLGCDAAFTSFPPAICAFCVQACKTYSYWRQHDCDALSRKRPSTFRCSAEPKSLVRGFPVAMQHYRTSTSLSLLESESAAATLPSGDDV